LLALLLSVTAAHAQSTLRALRRIASEYYTWRNQNYPVAASDAGLHTWDDRLTDYSRASIDRRRQHVRAVLVQVRAMNTVQWARDDRIDWLLFRSQLEQDDFAGRVLKFEETNPQLYTDTCSNAIFSLIKKDYDTPPKRAAAAMARLRAMPAMLAEARKNLAQPVRLYAQLAAESARAIDPLFKESLAGLTKGLSPGDQAAFDAARNAALEAIHEFADYLDSRKSSMPPFAPMGQANYEYLLHNVYLLPMSATQMAMLGEAELARYRGLEALLPDPAMADPDPNRNRQIPKNQREFLSAYESREQDILQFLKQKDLVTVPDYLGRFLIRQLPDAFKPTSPGGFMNPPGVYDKDPTGFYFIPTYAPGSSNFYIRAAIEEPRPILGHEGIPGHFLQLSIVNHLPSEIRRQHDDGALVEGWALYTEEMLLRRGFYASGSAAEGQVLRLSRYRAARVGVDVNLNTGRWTFDQAVNYFMQAGGLDKEAATGEAAGAASNPTQKMTYIVGKWQILRLLGKYRDKQGSDFSLKKFHDTLLGFGSLPVSVIQWLMTDDSSDLEAALHAK
jgi:uncharacterized protein (DUF885 family)